MRDNNFGIYLKKKRLERKLTLRELAGITGLTHGYISNVENGKMNANVEFIKSIKGALNIPINESMLRIEIDKGELDKFEKEVVQNDKNIIDFTPYTLFLDMYKQSIGKYFLVKYRLLSCKTEAQIYQETGISPYQLKDIEENGPKSIDEIKILGNCYENKTLVQEIADYSASILGIKEEINIHDILSLWTLAKQHDKTFEQIQREGEFTIEHKKYLTRYTDLYSLLKLNIDIYFKGKKISKHDEFRTEKMLELLYNDISFDDFQ